MLFARGEDTEAGAGTLPDMVYSQVVPGDRTKARGRATVDFRSDSRFLWLFAVADGCVAAQQGL